MTGRKYKRNKSDGDKYITIGVSVSKTDAEWLDALAEQKKETRSLIVQQIFADYRKKQQE